MKSSKLSPTEQKAFERHQAEALQVARDLKKHFKTYSKNGLIAVIMNQTNMIMSLKSEISKLKNEGNDDEENINNDVNTDATDAPIGQTVCAEEND